MMFEKTTPVMKSTLSRFTFFSNRPLATSGLNWSSLTITSAGRPPSLPPFIFSASRNAGRMSTPGGAGAPGGRVGGGVVGGGRCGGPRGASENAPVILAGGDGGTWGPCRRRRREEGEDD